VIEDGAQSFGATYKGRRSCALSTIGTTSFFPSKPLGCYGDGGALFTNDPELAKTIRQVARHGQDRRYHHVRIGVNSRLDTLQAAILMCKLDILDDETEKRQAVAARYTEALRNRVVTPTVRPDARSVWAQYTIRISDGRRNNVAARLKAAGVPTAIYYPTPLHRQSAYRHYHLGTDVAASERLSHETLSLPMHPYLDQDTQARIVSELVKALA